MTVRVTLIVMTVLGLVQRPSMASVFYRHDNIRLQDRHVTHTLVHETLCRCRVACFVDPKCSGYTIERVKEQPAVYRCSFTTGNFTRDNLTAVAVDQGITTLIRGPPCPASFVGVPRAGCFLIFSNRVTQAVAQTSCPSGSQLFTPDEQTPEVFWALAGYLKYTQPIQIWTSLTLNTGSFSSPSGRSISTALGKGFWASTEPNNFGGNEFCAMMGTRFDYRLVDVPCHITTSFVCQKY